MIPSLRGRLRFARPPAGSDNLPVERRIVRPLGQHTARRGGRRGRVETGEDEAHLALTDDGWRVALARYRPRGAARRAPVLLVHGLAACRVTFDLGPSVSLARRLASLGWDVWSLELRGHGRSYGGPWGHALDDHLVRDLPAALGAVREATGAPRVHAVGHSMGGILLLAHLARGGGRDLRSALAIASALDYHGTPSDFHGLARLAPLGARVPSLHLGALSRAVAPLLGRRPGPLERFMVWPSNVDAALLRRLYAVTFHTVSMPVLVQLASAFREGGLRSLDGSVRYLDGLAGVDTPTLTLVGDRDRQCHVEAARRSMAALRRGALVSLGRAAGHGDHYGHFDPLIGRRAPVEVWPHVERWLAEHDG